MTRIRYKKLEDGTLVSPPMLAGRDAVMIVLNPVQLSFDIVELGSKESLYSGNSVSDQMLRLDAKRALVGLGAIFMDEVRKPFVPNN